MSLRPPSTPRTSLLPQPGSALPTPTARRKSAISMTQRPPSALSSSQFDSLRQAIAHNDPHAYDSPPSGEVGIALAGDTAATDSAERRKLVLPGVRTGSAASIRSSTSSNPQTPRTPTVRSRTPNGFGSSTNRFAGPLPLSRADDEPKFDVGDEVTLEIAGEKMEGVVRFIGEVEGKAGTWGGVELDGAFAGRGKNDGSVKGCVSCFPSSLRTLTPVLNHSTQYFACSPACGLFLPLAKIHPKPKPRVTPGSRAAKYAGMSAKDLASRRTTLTSSTASPASPSKKSVATPRRSLSPTKQPRQSLSPTKSLASSTASAAATPKPTRLSRPSIGGTFTTPTARKHMGPTGTPKAPLASSIKRPPSSLRQHTAPDVPPIPSAYGLARSVTPSSLSGRITPSTPGGMIRRRTSLANSEASIARPTTPSIRSQSRQSFASSISRQSHRDNEELDELRKELEDARVRETEVRQLLEGSEKLGREMEDRLAEKHEQIRVAEERVALLEQDKARSKEQEQERLAGVEGEEGDREREKVRVRELEAKVAEMEQVLQVQKAAFDKLRLEAQHKSAAKEAELESLRERLDQAAKEHEDERVDLNEQIDKLRTAGQALCETYEEKIAEIELARLEAVELAETLQSQVSSSSNGASGSPVLSRSLSSSHSSAAAIDAENARADLEHLRSKVALLEEQLEEARMHLEQEVSDAKDRRARTGEVESMLKAEIKSLKEAMERSAKAESRTAGRIKELQDALTESQSTLEAERYELEGLRHEANGDASLADDLKRVSRELASAKADFEKLQRDAAQNSDLVTELREDLRAAEKEIERLQKLELPTPDSRRASVASTRSSIGGKDEATATRDQIVGLKSIISTLTEENQELLERNQTLLGESQELKSVLLLDLLINTVH
ncbi:SPOSA6832_02692, partial [Sporobolomyces salmonicolor]